MSLPDQTSSLDKQTMMLYRPVGQKELDLVKAAGYRAFPPRLLSQPIFYPVLNISWLVGALL